MKGRNPIVEVITRENTQYTNASPQETGVLPMKIIVSNFDNRRLQTKHNASKPQLEMIPRYTIDANIQYGFGAVAFKGRKMTAKPRIIP